jgi:hypothetical protein
LSTKSQTQTTEQKFEEIFKALDSVIALLKKVYGPEILDPETPPVVKPAEGSFVIKPGGWGAGDDPNKWSVKPMKDFPALFKVVDDDKGKNVATNFATQELAQTYIDYYKSNYKDPEPDTEEPETEEPKPEEPKPTEPPATGGGGTVEAITKDGIKVPVKIRGLWKYAVKEDWRDGGARFNMPAAGVSMVLVGAFTCDKDGGDDVSPKLLMGRHTGSPGQPVAMMGCGYDGGFKVGGGKVRMRAEGPHNLYTETLDDYEKSEPCLSCVGKWRVYMATVTQEEKGVRIKFYQDQGDCETEPANEWKLCYEYFDDGKIKKHQKGKMDLSAFPIRNLDHTKGTAQTVWRVDETPGLKQRWLAVAEQEV